MTFTNVYSNTDFIQKRENNEKILDSFFVETKKKEKSVNSHREIRLFSPLRKTQSETSDDFSLQKAHFRHF